MLNLYLGNFVDKNSFVHRLDGRAKILHVIALSMLSFSMRQLPEILIFSIGVLLIILIAKIQANHIFKNLRGFYSIFLFIFLMYVIFSNNKMIEGMIVLWRFLMLILISLSLTYTTPLSDLTLAIEKLSKPLKIFGIKPRNIAVMISIAIRFIPVMFLRLQRLREAMLARAANLRKLKIIKTLVMSLLERMFQSASTLSDAMSARLYNEDAQSNKIMNFKRNDYISFIGFLLFASILLSI